MLKGLLVHCHSWPLKVDKGRALAVKVCLPNYGSVISTVELAVNSHFYCHLPLVEALLSIYGVEKLLLQVG